MHWSQLTPQCLLGVIMFWTATVGVALFAIALTAFLPSKDGGTAFPSNVPWAGRKKQIFASLRARCRELSAGTKPIKEGYEQVQKISPYEHTSCTENA